MRHFTKLAALLLLLLPGSALAVAALETDSAGSISLRQDSWKQQQLLRCDADVSTENATNGEQCETGDWSKGLDCQGFTHLTVRHFEYSAAGTSQLEVWDCNNSTGFGLPGSENTAIGPDDTPDQATPIPLCVNVTAGAGVTIDGTTGAGGVQLFAPTPFSLNHIFFRLADCTSCDSTSVASCSR